MKTSIAVHRHTDKGDYSTRHKLMTDIDCLLYLKNIFVNETAVIFKLPAWVPQMKKGFF